MLARAIYVQRSPDRAREFLSDAEHSMAASYVQVGRGTKRRQWYGTRTNPQ